MAEEASQRSIGWGTQLIDKEKAALIGFFDEDNVMGWGDDGEFHHKIHLAGLGCFSVPQAVVYHKRAAGADRIYGSMRSRWPLIIETYAARTIVVLGPALLLYETILFAFLCLKGRGKEHVRAMAATIRNFPRLVSKRSKLQRLRVRPDADLLIGGRIYIRESFVNKPYLKFGLDVLNRIFAGYWRLCRRFI
jgi:GT2 family glycosyltransferase